MNKISIFAFIFATLLTFSQTVPVPQPKKQQTSFLGNLFSWGPNHNNPHHGGGGGPRPVQTLILAYVAQQALDYYFGDNGVLVNQQGGCWKNNKC